MNREEKKVKVLATVGPAIASREILEKVLPQIDYLRFNFSHSTHEIHRETLERALEVKKDLSLDFETVADIEGPKIRLGDLPSEVKVLKGDTIKITGDKSHEKFPQVIWCDYPKIHNDLLPESMILVDNGYVELEVTEIEGKVVICRATSDGVLKSRKTLNLPEVYVDLPMVTEKDEHDLSFIFNLNKFDSIAISFVRHAKDVLQFKQMMKENGYQYRIFAKVEDIYAVRNIKEICEASDVVVFARGDLGAEAPLEHLKHYQDECLKVAQETGTEFIVATQMLESMIDNPRPTRAEVIDVSYAVQSGADGVWMSAETSVGKYPLRALDWIHRIVNANIA